MKSIAITTRIPEQTYKEIPTTAKSKNSYIVEAIEEKIRNDKQLAIEQSLLTLVKEAENVDYAMDAQRRAMQLAD